jgi:malate dehydrogenase (oxaloacetate-decarboxylating)(NADP+)
MGVIASESRLVVREMFLEAAITLAAEVSDSDLAEGRVYPPLHKIRDVSLAIAVAIAQVAYAQGLARAPKQEDLRAHIKSLMSEPSYQSYV